MRCTAAAKFSLPCACLERPKQFATSPLHSYKQLQTKQKWFAPNCICLRDGFQFEHQVRGAGRKRRCAHRRRRNHRREEPGAGPAVGARRPVLAQVSAPRMLSLLLLLLSKSSSAVVWNCRWGGPRGRYALSYGARQTCYIVRGQVTATVEGSPERDVEFGSGDLVVFHRGTRCTWHIAAAVDMHYAFDPP
jgi:hypothetical protein